ncbi:Bax inhibitor-1/YccA family protein [Bogoriella caseilytica]|uniref:Putative YccA/Bax inhibitor family protein n=1 Tax=Bogoriella caseilytica TaxID=56055 RepID=A0A3N2BAC8_9MICO|nr:Bax inhibitor-1/YccA family protein [Bogoriella caseilytica]ROR72221.1 putative YccA/Bax inhibitor family protein [Bogoriella caseilytica]
MSNPVFERTPAFSSKQTTPNGYRAMPGYTPGQQGGHAAGRQYGTQQYAGQQYGQQAGQDPRMDQIEQSYYGPTAAPADTGRMTYDDVIMRTGMVLGVIITLAAIHWVVIGPNMLLTFGGLAVGFVLGLVNAFKREPSPALIMAYAVAQGLFLGGISAVFDTMFGDGIVTQAVIGTMATFAVSLLLFKSGAVRVTPKFTRWLLIAVAGYAVFSLINFGLIMLGFFDDAGQAFGLRTSVEIMGIPLGVLLGVFAIGLAALCLIMDFDAIKRGVDGGAPSRYAWSAAFGIAVTLVWLYIEFLRLLAILRGSN